MIASLFQIVLRRASLVVATGLILGVAGGVYTVRLYQNLRPDLQEMLPTEERSVVDLNEIATRLRSIDSLTVLIFSADAEASRRLVDDLARALRDAPPDVIAGVEYKISDELDFFARRRALYMDLDDLQKIRKYIRDRIDYETNIRNPLNIFSGIELPIPRLNFDALQQEYQSRVAIYTRFPGGYYATPDGTKRALLVNAPGRATDITQARRLRATVDDKLRRLDPSRYATDIRIAFTGGVQNIIEEQEALINDLKRSAVVVGTIVLLAMLLYFRSWIATFALLFSVSVATLVTFGLSYFLIGYLNANSAFLGSIVVGNGINFGIIFLARTLEWRRKAEPIDICLTRAASLTATSTWTAALAAGLAYGSLVITDFRGFRQFGIIGLIGMVLCWIAAFTLLPAILQLSYRGRVQRTVALTAEPHIGFLPRLLERTALPISALTLVGTVVALTFWPKFSPEIIEANLAKLRSKKSLLVGSAFYARTQDEIFKRYLSPTVILPKNLQQTREIAERLRNIAERDSLIASVQTLDDFIPREQGQKISIIRDIRYLLPQKLLRELPAKERRLALELTQTPLRPVSRAELPPMILDKFTERNGRIGNLVLVEPPLGDEIRKRENLHNFVRTLREVADSVAPGTPVAGTLPVSADTLSSIARDGPKATLLSLIAVVLLVSVLFRNLRSIVSVLFALALGVTWLSGLILALDLRINFLNFIALPLTFGLGVDYGVNVFQRYRQEGRGGMGVAVQETGGAVALCCFTTVVGYGSLLMAQNLAFVSFGVLAVLGTLTCVTAALISVPAYRMLRDRRKLSRDHRVSEEVPPQKKEAMKRAG